MGRAAALRRGDAYDSERTDRPEPEEGDVTVSRPLRVRARRKVLAVLWLTLAAVVLGLVVAGAPDAYRNHPAICDTTRPSCEPIDADDRADLDDAGTSPQAIAAYDGVGIPAFTILVFVGVAAVIVWRRPRDGFAVFTATALLLFGTVAAGSPTESLAAAHPALETPHRLLDWAGQVSFAALFYLFPDGRWAPRWTRWLLVVVAFFWAVDIFAPGSAIDLFAGPGFLLFLISLVGAQVYRYRNMSTPVARQQTKWVLFGTCTAIGVFSVLFAIGTVNEAMVDSVVGLTVLRTGMYAALTVVPLSVAVAILRHRLWDIDVVINRTLMWVALSSASVATYLVVVAAVSALVPSVPGIPPLVAAAVVALTFAPLRGRMQATFNRLLYGDRDDPHAVVTRLGSRLDATLAPEAVAQTIVDTVSEALRVPHVSLEAAYRDAESVEIATVGQPGSESTRVPLSYAGSEVGFLVVSPRPGERTLRRRDLRLLEDLSHHAGLALHALRLLDESLSLSADLRRSRQQLVTAREEERRRLRRDLHDGLGPQLASVALKAETVRDLVPAHLHEAVDLLDQISGQAEQSVAEVRHLVDGLRPSALDDLTLVGAIRSVASQLNGRMTIDVSGPDPTPELPAVVEVAAYRIIQEALHNAVRHSCGTHASVELRVVDDALEVSVRDNGRGGVHERDGGVGLRSMRERAAEVGGTFELDASNNRVGTHALARLPLVER